MRPQFRSALVVVLVMSVAGCSREQPLAAAPPSVVTAMVVKPTAVELTDNLPGRVLALRTAQIRPQVGGIVTRRLFEQGAEVKAGQVLFQINPAPFQADLNNAIASRERAAASYRYAQQQLDRMAPLLKADAVSKQVFDEATNQRDQTKAALQEAIATVARRELDLRFAKVDTPITGRVDQTLVTEGALVTQSDTQPMATVQQIDRVYVDVRQPASKFEQIRAELASGRLANDGTMPVRLLSSSGAEYKERGRVLFSGVTVDAGTGDLIIRIEVDNPERTLLPGLYVRALVPSGTDDHAILLPQEAIARGLDGEAAVWVAGADGKAHRRAVILGEMVGRSYLVNQGLKPGEQVVLEGADKLQDGAPVQLRKAAAAQPTAAVVTDR